jgi:putative restriction endonuclease
MKFWVGVTDNDWYAQLSRMKADEVNFWQPSATPPFTNAPVGLPFLFKLKGPYNHIAGGGFFVTYSSLPLRLAWSAFEQKNGCASLEALVNRMAKIRGAGAGLGDIGCSVLSNVEYFPEHDWIPDPPGWARTETEDGAAIWDAYSARMNSSPEIVESQSAQANSMIKEIAAGYGQAVPIQPRIGQSAFRVLVTDAYKRRCAITGESTLMALEAAHIKPFSQDSSHAVSNGILLRADFHRLFDSGLISITPDLRTRVSPKIRESWYNGKAYYRLDNQPVAVLPDEESAKPDRDRLSWHFENVFQAS